MEKDKPSVIEVLKTMAEKNPALKSLADNALESLASGEDSAETLVDVAKRLCISRGIDLDIGEDDPDMLVYAFAEAIISMNSTINSYIGGTSIDMEDPTDEELDKAYEESRRLRTKLKSFAIAEQRCSAASGFWDKIPESLHYIYANMLVDLCQGWEVIPPESWTNKARG